MCICVYVYMCICVLCISVSVYMCKLICVYVYVYVYTIKLVQGQQHPWSSQYSYSKDNARRILHLLHTGPAARTGSCYLKCPRLQRCPCVDGAIAQQSMLSKALFKLSASFAPKRATRPPTSDVDFELFQHAGPDIAKISSQMSILSHFSMQGQM